MGRMTSMRISSQKQIESFSLNILPITVADIPGLHQLSVAAGWAHRPEDWEFVLQMGEGVFAADQIGRIVGSAMFYPLSEDFGALGMVIIAPRLVEHGTSHWLIEHMIVRAGERDLTVAAIPDAYPVYISFGFRAGPTVFQCQGIVAGNSTVIPGARQMQPDDLSAVHQLDTRAFPVPRARILDLVMPMSSGTVIEKDGCITGFALRRPFGRGQIIGPVVALDDDDAIALVAPHLAACEGSFVRVDTREPEGGRFRNYLHSAGLKLHDTVISMARGSERTAPGPQRVFSLLNQGVG